jgi:alkylation response protein AidB-like acyl-CoA dehydrogenase
MGERQEEYRAARDLTEQAREHTWTGHSFMRELFLGSYRPALLRGAPVIEVHRPQVQTFLAQLEHFLVTEVDANAIDEKGEYPQEVLSGLAEIGAFGMKIPQAYGGLGLDMREYMAAMELVGSHDANVAALLSAHQAIGVPQPLLLFGSEQLKQLYLPRCARGAISGFALTEPAVGSDPGRLGTTAQRLPNGDWVLNGAKLWCTNGTIADLLVVLARDVETTRIHCFVVEMAWPGVSVESRCHFMGLHALANGVIGFRDVRVPARNLVGREGDGLKIALTTLNAGRLTLPAATAGGAKRCLEIARKWSNARKQWGRPIGEHQAITHKLSSLACTTFAMDALALSVGGLADSHEHDIRMEAAAAKEWNTQSYWRMLDDTLQIRGGRGYENESSLEQRGEAPVGVERMMRDARVNLIFEGSSEVIHLFLAREALDRHMQVAFVLVDPKASIREKLSAIPRIVWFYLTLIPRLLFGLTLWPKYREYGPLAGTLRFAERTSRRVARSLLFSMLRFGPKLEQKQARLFRLVDIGLELLVLTAVVQRAHDLRAKVEGRSGALDLARHYALEARTRIATLFRELGQSRIESARTRTGQQMIAGRLAWLEEGALPLAFDASQLVPPTMNEILAARDDSAASPASSGVREAVLTDEGAMNTQRTPPRRGALPH